MEEVYMSYGLVNITTDHNTQLKTRCITFERSRTNKEPTFNKLSCLKALYHRVIYIKDIDKQLIETGMYMNPDYNFCITLDDKTIISEIFDSFPNDKINSIYSQFETDFNRMNIKINGQLCSDINEFVQFTTTYSDFVFNPYLSLQNLMFMCANQAMFYYSFSILHKLFNKEESGMYILPDIDRPSVDFVITDNKILTFIFRKTFNLKTIETEEIHTKFHTFIIMTINLHDIPAGYFFYRRQLAECESFVLYWIRENKCIC
jgi:hypothetical protein